MKSINPLLDKDGLIEEYVGYAEARLRSEGFDDVDLAALRSYYASGNVLTRDNYKSRLGYDAIITTARNLK